MFSQRYSTLLLLLRQNSKSYSTFDAIVCRLFADLWLFRERLGFRCSTQISCQWGLWLCRGLLHPFEKCFDSWHYLQSNARRLRNELMTDFMQTYSMALNAQQRGSQALAMALRTALRSSANTTTASTTITANITQLKKAKLAFELSNYKTLETSNSLL